MDGGGPGFWSAGIGQIDDEGCAYILETNLRCGKGRWRRSSYCRHHHALCHLPEGSERKRRRLRIDEALAAAVGGKRGREDRVPPEPFLRRLESIVRRFSRPDCSRIVPRKEER